MKRKVYFLLSFIIAGGAAYAQNTSTTDLIKAKTYADEVFANCMVYSGPAYIPEYAEMISRVSVITETFSAQEGYPLMSSVMLKNKCNPLMPRDENNFNPNSFNPLKYFFNFYPTADTKYRVDNSNYVILIHPKP